MVFEISLLQTSMSKIAKGNNLKKAKENNSKINLKTSPGNSLLILYLLAKDESPRCNSFLRYQVFYVQIFKGPYPLSKTIK